MKILLFGKNGQVGWELNRSLQPLGEVIALGRQEADFSRPETLRDIVRATKPDIIVNAVAYTAVDKAEEEEELAKTINGTSVGVLAEEAKNINALFVHYSTDYVFDGTKKRAYVEEDTVNPLNAYGVSKLLGEQKIANSGCDFIVLRTAWVYGVRGSNFLLTMVRLMKEREVISVVYDQTGTPTCSRHIAESTAKIVEKAQTERSENKFFSDIYHLTSSGETTWYGFAEKISEITSQLMGDGYLVLKDLIPIKSSEYPVPAKRPENSLLASTRVENKYKLIMPSWEQCLESSLHELCCHENQL